MTPPMVRLKCKRLHTDAKLPYRTGTHGVNVNAYLKSETGHATKMVLPTGMTRSVPTGLSVTPDPPYAVLLHASVNLSMLGVNVLNPLTTHPRELNVTLHNSGRQTQWIEHDDPIAHLVLLELPTPVVVEDLS